MIESKIYVCAMLKAAYEFFKTLPSQVFWQEAHSDLFSIHSMFPCTPHTNTYAVLFLTL